MAEAIVEDMANTAFADPEFHNSQTPQPENPNFTPEQPSNKRNSLQLNVEDLNNANAQTSEFQSRPSPRVDDLFSGVITSNNNSIKNGGLFRKNQSQKVFKSIYSEYTFTPQINPVSQEIKRDVDHLYKWKETVDKKLEMQRELKSQIEAASTMKKVFTDQKSEEMLAGTRPKIPVEDILLAKEQERLYKIQKLSEKIYGMAAVNDDRRARSGDHFFSGSRSSSRNQNLLTNRSQSRSHSRSSSQQQRGMMNSFRDVKAQNLRGNKFNSGNNGGIHINTHGNVRSPVANIYKNYASPQGRKSPENVLVQSFTGEILPTIEYLLDEEEKNNKIFHQKFDDDSIDDISKRNLRAMRRSPGPGSQCKREPPQAIYSQVKPSKNSTNFSGKKENMPKSMQRNPIPINRIAGLDMEKSYNEKEQYSLSNMGSTPRTASAIVGMGDLEISELNTGRYSLPNRPNRTRLATEESSNYPKKSQYNPVPNHQGNQGGTPKPTSPSQAKSQYLRTSSNNQSSKAANGRNYPTNPRSGQPLVNQKSSSAQNFYSPQNAGKGKGPSKMNGASGSKTERRGKLDPQIITNLELEFKEFESGSALITDSWDHTASTKSIYHNPETQKKIINYILDKEDIKNE